MPDRWGGDNRSNFICPVTIEISRPNGGLPAVSLSDRGRLGKRRQRPVSDPVQCQRSAVTKVGADSKNGFVAIQCDDSGFKVLEDGVFRQTELGFTAISKPYSQPTGLYRVAQYRMPVTIGRARQSGTGDHTVTQGDPPTWYRRAVILHLGIFHGRQQEQPARQ